MDNIAAIKTRLSAEIEKAATIDALDAIRVAALGKKGEVSMLGHYFLLYVYGP